ncbi:MAG TPA: 50S ribosomal protein L29 [Candidatus Paceibacterota bacterium]|nr:50S ribosomal protein L29 [Candidatus Paceibacterota bacterium]
MDITHIRKQSDKELEKFLAEKHVDLQKFRFDITGSKVKNVKSGRDTRRAIAQILTEQRARKSAN